MPEEGKFLKGLAVLDDIAYFGITTWAERSVRDSPDNDGELAAFDLVSNRLLWRRTVSEIQTCTHPNSHMRACKPPGTFRGQCPDMGRPAVDCESRHHSTAVTIETVLPTHAPHLTNNCFVADAVPCRFQLLVY